MKNAETVSVIVPVYRVESYLRQCVDSIICQTYQRLEIILVDDGSPDACPSICDEYAQADPRVRVIHQENGGLSAARNTGLDAATGDYIAFVDSDDWIEPDMIERLLSACNAFRTDIAFVGRVCFGDDHPTWNEHITPPRRLTVDEMIRETLRHEMGYLAVWDKLYRAFLFDHVRFPMGEFYEDEAVFYPIFRQANGVAYAGVNSYHYRVRSNSISNFESMKTRISLKEKHIRELDGLLQAERPGMLPFMLDHKAYVAYELLEYAIKHPAVAGDPAICKQLKREFNRFFPQMVKKGSPFDRRKKITAAIIRLGLYPFVRKIKMVCCRRSAF